MLAGNVASHGVDHDGRAEHDEKYRDNKLQTVGNEHRAPSRFTGGNGNRCCILDGTHHGHQPLHQRREGDAEHDDKRREQGSVFTAGDFQEYAQGNEYQCAQQLIGTSEQRPDIGISDTCQDICRDQCDDC